MGILSIIEPAGTLLTGWELIPTAENVAPRVPAPADRPHRDAGPDAETEPGKDDRSPPPLTASRPTRSKWELREVG
ncbi:hypothetical protein [Novosphingobium sp.]|uniref:hypothetical protein n=1 Tax=Novosphingobium sp. TaxID=1874826 RepID=UPI002631D2EF|nr:hypothetical protein [Novosphingobium sp.]